MRVSEMGIVAGAFLLFLILGVLLLRRARRVRLGTGLPQGKVVVADTSGWRQCAAPLYAARYRLAGRPDYVVETGGHHIPVEVKPGRRAAAPYASDILQLAAYCLLVEETWGRPPYGLLRYAAATFQIPYTDALRMELLALLAEMRRQRAARHVGPNHRQPARCARCGYRDVCGEALGQRPTPS